MLPVVAEGWQGTEGIRAAIDRVSCGLLGQGVSMAAGCSAGVGSSGWSTVGFCCSVQKHKCKLSGDEGCGNTVEP